MDVIYFLAAWIAVLLVGAVWGIVEGRIRIISKDKVEAYDRIMLDEEVKGEISYERERRKERDKRIEDAVDRQLAELKQEEPEELPDVIDQMLKDAGVEAPESKEERSRRLALAGLTETEIELLVRKGVLGRGFKKG